MKMPVFSSLCSPSSRNRALAAADNTVLRRMGPRDISRLPVVSRDDPRRLLGVIRRNDLVRAYNLALVRRRRRDDRSL